MNLRHEMKHMPEAATWLHWAIERVLRPNGWVLRPIRGGYNSFCLSKPGDARQFHFRWWRSYPDRVFVLDRYHRGRKLGALRTLDDVTRFVVAVDRGRRWP